MFRKLAIFAVAAVSLATSASGQVLPVPTTDFGELGIGEPTVGYVTPNLGGALVGVGTSDLEVLEKRSIEINKSLAVGSQGGAAYEAFTDSFNRWKVQDKSRSENKLIMAPSVDYDPKAIFGKKYTE